MADYTRFVEEYGTSPADAAQANIHAAEGTPQSAAVVAFKAAPTTGVDPSLGMVDPAQAGGLRSYVRDSDLAGQPSAVQAFAARSPAHVAATREDWPMMGDISQTLIAGVRGIPAGLVAAEQATYGVGATAAGLLGMTEAQKGFLSAAQKLQRAREKAAGPVPQSFIGSAVAGAGQSIGINAPGMVASVITRNPAFALSAGATTQGGLSAQRALELGKTPAQAASYGSVDAALEAVFEKIPLVKLLDDIKVGASFKRILLGNLAREVPTEVATTIGQNLNEWAQLNPTKPISQFLAEQPKAVADTIAQTLIQTGATVGTVEAARRLGGLPTEQDIAKAHAENATAIATKVGELSFHAELPQLTREFLSHTGVGQETVWVDPEALAELYAAGEQPFSDRMGEIGAALTQGREVELPAAEFYAEVGGKPWQDAVIARTRFEEEGVSVEEGKGLPAAANEDQYGSLDPTTGVPWDPDMPVSARIARVLQAHPELQQVPFEPDVPFPEDVTAEVPRELPAAVSSAVEEVFAEHMLSSLFTDAKALKMNKGQFERYDNMLAEAKAATEERVLRRTYDQIRRERTPEWKDAVGRQTAAVEEEVFASRAHAARMELQYGEGPDGSPLQRDFEPNSIFQDWGGGMKLDKQAAVDAYGAAAVAALPPKMFVKNGLHPDDVAGALNYDSGEEMILDLLKLEANRVEGGYADTKAHVKGAIKEEAEGRARAALGYDISREGLIAAAKEAAILPQVEDFLEASLRDLADEVGVPFDKEALRAEAKRQFDTLPVKEAVNVRSFERGMWRTGQKTQEGLEKGDWPAAFVGRQQQLLNFYQLEMSHFLRKKVAVADKTFRRLARKNTIRGLSQPFLNQLHTYLPQWGYSVGREPQELAEALKGVTLEEFVAEVISTNAAFMGIPDVKPALLMTLKVDDYWKVRAFILGMNRYGRELQTARSAGKKEDRAEVVQMALASIPPGKPPKGPPAPIDVDPKKGPLANISSALREFDAFHRKATDFVEWMDRGDSNGVWAQNITHPMMDGADVQGRLHREAYAPVIAAWGKVPDGVKRAYDTKIVTGFTANGRELQLYRRNIVRMALYAGTEERLLKAAEGFGVTPEAYLAVINAHISPEEVALVEAMWAGFEELAPRVSEARRSLTGEGLRRVEARPVELGGQMTKGGYVPLKYNRSPGLNPAVLAWEAERDAQLSPDGVDQLFGQVMLDEGFAQAVTGYVGPVDVELNGIAGLFNAHINYAAYAKPVSDVRKFVYAPLIAAAIERTFGKEYLNIIPDWLNGIVRPFSVSEKSLGVIERGMEGLGRAMSTASLAFSYGTLVSQAAGVVNGVAVLSQGNLLRGSAAMLGGYRDALQSLLDGTLEQDFADSEFLRQRYGQLEQNMTEALMEADDLVVRGKVKEGIRHLERVGFQTIGWVEFATVSYPLWKGAKKQALTEGMSAKEAVRFANRMVTKSQGGGRKVDQAAVQRARGMYKLMYAFQSYFNQQYQLMIDVYRNVKGATAAGGGGGNQLPPPPEALEAEMGPDGVWVVPRKVRYRIAQAAILAVLVFVLGGVIANWLTHRKQSVLDPLLNLLRPIFGLNTVARAVSNHVEFKDGKFGVKNAYDASFGDDLFNRAGEILLTNALNASKIGQRTKAGAPRKMDRPVQNAVALLPILAAPFGVRIPGAAAVGRAGEYLYERGTGDQRPRSGKEWTDTYVGLTGGPQTEQKRKRR